jgi:hypothetical protein
VDFSEFHMDAIPRLMLVSSHNASQEWVEGQRGEKVGSVDDCKGGVGYIHHLVMYKIRL